jgi:hypothetical protein
VLIFVLALSAAQAPAGELYVLITLAIYAPVGAAAKALQGMYGTAAAYRLFRTRSLRTYAVMFITFMVILRMTTLGDFIPSLAPAADYLIKYVQGAVYRAFTISFAFGGIYLGIRFLLGRELRIFGRVEEEEVQVE